MRSTILTLLASIAIVSATGCAQDNIDELAARTSCGKSNTIAKCLHAAVDLARLEDVEWCFIAGGCEVADATEEAVWFTYDCRAFEVQEAEKDLRKRADSSTEVNIVQSTAKSTAAKTTTAKTTAAKTTSAAVASTTAVTTSAAPTTSASAASTADSTASSTTSTSSDSTTTGTAASATTTGPLTCSVTSTVSTSMCSVTDGKTVSCFPTTTAIASCAPGVICFEADANGADVCMRRDDSISTSGIVVTIIFAVGIIFTIICFVVSAFNAKRKAKKDASDRLLAAANSGRGKDIEGANVFSGGQNAGASDSNLPLMTPGGQRSENYSGSQQDYFGQGQQQQGPPRLNPGLGALGQNTRY